MLFINVLVEFFFCQDQCSSKTIHHSSGISRYIHPHRRMQYFVQSSSPPNKLLVFCFFFVCMFVRMRVCVYAFYVWYLPQRASYRLVWFCVDVSMWSVGWHTCLKTSFQKCIISVQILYTIDIFYTSRGFQRVSIVCKCLSIVCFFVLLPAGKIINYELTHNFCVEQYTLASILSQITQYIGLTSAPFYPQIGL